MVHDETDGLMGKAQGKRAQVGRLLDDLVVFEEGDAWGLRGATGCGNWVTPPSWAAIENSLAVFMPIIFR